MSFTLLQVGKNLRSVNSTGALSPVLALPTGVTLVTNLVPRFARFNRYVILVNTPSRPLSIGDDGTVRLLTPAPPSSQVILTGPHAGALTGTYLAKQTYKLLDASSNVISESDYGPAEPVATAIVAKKLLATFPLSTDKVDASQLYRTTTLGQTYFTWLLISGNVTKSVEDDTSDAGLGIAQGPFLGTAPDLTLIAEFGGRLWGVSRTNVDTLRYTEAGTMYGWSVLNVIPIPHVGSDGAGVTALIPRRNALGVARLSVFNQITGTDRTNFNPTVVQGGENVGCISQESVVVFNDVAYFLWRDGVYTWDSTGIRSITNGRVRSWFTTDTYFNRAMFWRAFAQLDPFTLKYRLFLASVGSTNCDRWIEYDLQTNTWWGPHNTDAFVPTSAVLVAGSNAQPWFMVGSLEGYLSQDQEDKNDWGVSPINLSVQTKKHDTEDDHEHEKYWGELSILGKVQPTPLGTGIVTVTPIVGDVDTAVPGVPFLYDMSLGRHRLGRCGVGKFLTLQFDHKTINQDVALYGYEVDPVSIIGRR
jgi:hypothetical protein